MGGFAALLGTPKGFGRPQVAPCLLLPHGTYTSKATAGCPPPCAHVHSQCLLHCFAGADAVSEAHWTAGGCSLCHKQATFIQEPMKHERVWASIIALIKTENHILHSNNYFKEQTKCRGMNRLNKCCNYGSGRTTAPPPGCRVRLFGQRLGAACCPPIPTVGDTGAPDSTAPSPAQPQGKLTKHLHLWDLFVYMYTASNSTTSGWNVGNKHPILNKNLRASATVSFEYRQHFPLPPQKNKKTKKQHTMETTNLQNYNANDVGFTKI